MQLACPPRCGLGINLLWPQCLQTLPISNTLLLAVALSDFAEMRKILCKDLQDAWRKSSAKANLKIHASKRHRIRSLIHYKTHVTTNPAKCLECLQPACKESAEHLQKPAGCLTKILCKGTQASCKLSRIQLLDITIIIVRLCNYHGLSEKQGFTHHWESKKHPNEEIREFSHYQWINGKELSLSYRYKRAVSEWNPADEQIDRVGKLWRD